MTQENIARTGHTVVGVFDRIDQAEQTINDLKIAGFTPDSISVVTRDARDQKTLLENTEVGNEAGQGTLVGSLGGGTLGAVLGWLLAGGTALIPGIGPVVAAGIFGATVSGALIGGALGGIAGALAGSGIPETEAAEYEEHVRGGRTLVTVNAANGNLLEAAMDVFERNNATNTRYYDMNQPGAGRDFNRDNTATTTPYETTTTTTTRTVDTNPLPSDRYDDPNRNYRASDTSQAGSFTSNSNISPTNSQDTQDVAAANRTIYADGHSDIADPQEFDRQNTRQAGQRVDRYVEEQRTLSQGEADYENTPKGGIYADPTFEPDADPTRNPYPPTDSDRGLPRQRSI